MKNKVRVFICLFALIFVLPVFVFAGAWPTEMNIVADINYDGSMTVTETITWEMEEEINGIYRDVKYLNPANELNSATNIQVHTVQVNGKTFPYSEVKLENGDGGRYNLNKIDGGAQIKVFCPTDEYELTTVMQYTLSDVVVEYADVSEVYWNFIGKGWADGVEDATITVRLPEDSERLKIFGHGPLNGYCEIVDQSTAIFKIPYIRSGEAIDARILFDTDIVYAEKFQDKNMYETIIEREYELAREADLRRERYRMCETIISIVSYTCSAIILFFCLALRLKKLKRKEKIQYYRELPEDYGVPVMNYLLHKHHKDNENMLATLMDLVRKKYIKINPVTKEGKPKPEDYELVLIKEDLSELNAVEQHYIKKLIFVDCTSIKLKELKKKNTKNVTARKKAGVAFRKWQSLIEKEYKACKLKRTGKTKAADKVMWVSLAMFPVSVITIIICGMLAISNSITALGVLLLFVSSIGGLVWSTTYAQNVLVDNEKALEHIEKWKGFKRFLKHFSKMEEKDYGSIVLWEHYLVYAIGLGIADKVLKQLKDIYPEITTLDDTYSGIYNSSSYHSFSNSFNSASTGAFTYSSSTGSGGGFSGGGGGRRRRWRRRQLLIHKNKLIIKMREDI